MVDHYIIISSNEEEEAEEKETFLLCKINQNANIGEPRDFKTKTNKLVFQDKEREHAPVQTGIPGDRNIKPKFVHKLGVDTTKDATKSLACLLGDLPYNPYCQASHFSWIYKNRQAT